MPPNDHARAARLRDAMSAFDGLMQRMAASHAPEIPEVDVTMSQAKVLFLVYGLGPLRMSDLTARLGVTPSTTSELVERLVEAGLVERRDDPADRRSVILTMTGAGAASLDRMRELNARQLEVLLDRVSDDDLAVVDRALHILTAAIDAMPDPRKDPE
jgi:DNA-binding MarR family transcriptional regulator